MGPAEQAVSVMEAMAELARVASDPKKNAAILSDLKKAIAENKKQVKMIGAPAEIERNLAEAESKNAASESILEEATVTARKLVEQAEDGLVSRDKALNDRNAALDAATAEMRAGNDKAIAEMRKRRSALDAAERKFGDLRADIEQRLEDVTKREKNVEARERRAKKASEEAKDLTRRVQAAMQAGA